MAKDTSAAAEIKQRVGYHVVDTLVQSGMKIGLGTGSTAIHSIRRIAERLKSGALTDIVGVGTSFQSLVAAQDLGIPVRDFNDPEIDGTLDITIDGADEIDPDRRIIKGGGAAHLIEKLVSYHSKVVAIVADESKLSPHLGARFPVPLEVVTKARLSVARTVRATYGCDPQLRMAQRKDGPVITDHGNFILDLHFAAAFDAVALEAELNEIPGVVENGLFTRITPRVFVAGAGGAVREFVSMDD